MKEKAKRNASSRPSPYNKQSLNKAKVDKLKDKKDKFLEKVKSSSLVKSNKSKSLELGSFKASLEDIIRSKIASKGKAEVSTQPVSLVHNNTVSV
jgi:hypothetical protein